MIAISTRGPSRGLDTRLRHHCLPSNVHATVRACPPTRGPAPDAFRRARSGLPARRLAPFSMAHATPLGRTNRPVPGPLNHAKSGERASERRSRAGFVVAHTDSRPAMPPTQMFIIGFSLPIRRASYLRLRPRSHARKSPSDGATRRTRLRPSTGHCRTRSAPPA